MYYKISYLIILLVCSYTQCFSQQEPLFSHYRLNAFLVNPAYAGSSEIGQIRFNHRSQWNRFPGSPTTNVLSLQGPVDEKNGLGLILFSDAQGPTNRQGVQGAYAFHIPLADRRTKLSFGMAVKALQYKFLREQVYFQDPTDAAIAEASQSIWTGDLAFGTYLYNDRLFVGFSAPNLIQTGLDLGPETSREIISKLYRHYFLMGGYRFDYEKVSIEPSVMVKKVANTPYQIEGAVRFYLVDRQLFVGGSYRTDWRTSILFGFNVKNFHFVYSTDFMAKVVNTTGSVFGITNEFSLGIDLGQGKSSLYFQERK